jgi:hypothetical protein
MRFLSALVVTAALLSGCNDGTVVAPRDTTPPASPRGLQTVTGDHEVFLSWFGNTEADVAGYRVYDSDCATCLYDPIGNSNSTTFRVSSLANGQTRYFAVAAVDYAGNESELSYDTVFDTPRPEGSGLVLSNALTDSVHAGYDFSAYSVRSQHDPNVDIFYGSSGGQTLIVAPFIDTDIQDAGYATTLDAVDFAPTAGWSPSGTVEPILGHCYIVLTNDDHYAKFRVTSLTSGHVTLDWAYQVDAGNRELAQRRDKGEGARRVRRALPQGV